MNPADSKHSAYVPAGNSLNGERDGKKLPLYDYTEGQTIIYPLHSSMPSVSWQVASTVDIAIWGGNAAKPIAGQEQEIGHIDTAVGVKVSRKDLFTYGQTGIEKMTSVQVEDSPPVVHIAQENGPAQIVVIPALEKCAGKVKLKIGLRKLIAFDALYAARDIRMPDDTGSQEKIM